MNLCSLFPTFNSLLLSTAGALLWTAVLCQPSSRLNNHAALRRGKEQMVNSSSGFMAKDFWPIATGDLSEIRVPEDSLEREKYALKRRGMKVTRSKTKYMCVN
ncbi:hypothetical protein ATANTOWER_005950 [Ataeniobius toweri]|uniref:Uncharacterized protein n=1 Tax=Ataeniobius toweri TaxID=208326 RepID=A0ABU7BR46_9TELE|nr:hypothetical protein [Ataeniobius toweri]